MEVDMVADMEVVKVADMFKTKCIKPKMSTFMSATHDNPEFPIGWIYTIAHLFYDQWSNPFFRSRRAGEEEEEYCILRVG